MFTPFQQGRDNTNMRVALCRISISLVHSMTLLRYKTLKSLQNFYAYH